jgi:tRNA(Ile2) C34 agmatinyltransferase TiaS
MTNDESSAQAAPAGNPNCPECGHRLSGEDLKELRCAGCGAELPPRLGI